MQERKYMIQWREKRKVTLDVMAKAANVSRYTLENIEQDDTYVTAPPIAQKIADAYKLSKKQYYSMIPENYRPGPNYDPGRYVEDERDFGVFSIAPRDKVRGTFR